MAAESETTGTAARTAPTSPSPCAQALTPRALHDAYVSGRNVSAILRECLHVEGNTEAIIEIAYDLQAGSYTRAMADPGMAQAKAAFFDAVAEVVTGLGAIESLLEAGVGEATTLAGVLTRLTPPPPVAGGFDLSWSRIAEARRWLASQDLGDVHLCTASLLDIPCADDSVDLVFTSHAIEPNGGRELSILQELYRVTRKWLLLLEPGYELAGPEARARMAQHGYCRGLPDLCRELGYDVVEHRLFPISVNPMNPTALLLIRKHGADAPTTQDIWVCPRYKTPLADLGGMLYSPEALSVYPRIAGIPCLRVDNAILASHYPEVVANPTATSGTDGT